ncbi:uncharacterized protein LOC134743401 [Cydia strobilella]|uniref:uncharacterized protein LOC134743401 n=1 Tax=Cydia strobilella TaxID=1100964 RepID=UPI003005964C
MISTYISDSTVATYSNDSEINNVTVYPDAETQATTPYVQNDMLKRLLDLSEKTDQNPSDPETARELEEALENMEKALASPPVSNKVRRDLRQPKEFKDTPEQRENEPVPQKELPKEQTQTQKFKEIGTPDSAPIMAILTKYAPLIKSYENIFRRSDASNTTLSLEVLVLGFLVSHSL